MSDVSRRLDEIQARADAATEKAFLVSVGDDVFQVNPATQCEQLATDSGNQNAAFRAVLELHDRPHYCTPVGSSSYGFFGARPCPTVRVITEKLGEK